MPHMIRVTRRNRIRAENLLGEHNPHQPVRPGGAAKGQPVMGTGDECGGKPVLPANGENHPPRATYHLALEEGGKRLACHLFAAGIQHQQLARRGKQRLDFLCFLRLTRSAVEPGRRIRNFFERDFPACLAQVLLYQHRFRALLCFSYGCNENFHTRIIGLSDHRFLHRPHFFKMVMFADFWAEEMNHNIARINQDPVARFLPLGSPSETGFTKRFDDRIRE